MNRETVTPQLALFHEIFVCYMIIEKNVARKGGRRIIMANNIFGDYQKNCRDTTVHSDGRIVVSFYDAYDLLSYNPYGSKTYSSWDEYAADVPEGERDLSLEEYQTCLQVEIKSAFGEMQISTADLRRVKNALLFTVSEMCGGEEEDNLYSLANRIGDLLG